MSHTSYSAYGTLIQRGDGGIGAATLASKTIGTVNQQLKVLAKVAGAAGNSKTFGIVVSGNSTAFSIVVTAGSVLINSATDSGGLATTTVLQAIASLYANATFNANFDATVGTGTGSGVLVAGAAAVLSGGADGAEVFTTIDGAKNITGPSFSMAMIDSTHHTSASSYRQVIPSFKTAGEVSLDLIYDPALATHVGILADFEARVRRNWQMILPDLGTMTLSFAAYVSGADLAMPIDNVLSMAVKLGIDGPVTLVA